MDTGLFKQALTSQTIFGAVQFVVVFLGFGGVLVGLQSYHANDRKNFSCPSKPGSKPDDFNCYDEYTSTMSPWLIPRNVVAIIYGVLCLSWICFSLYTNVTIRQIKRDQEAQPNHRQAQWGKLHCMYNIHVVFRLVFLGGMIAVFCSSQTLDLPSEFECNPHTSQTNKNSISVNQTESAMQCKDPYYKEKSILNIAILVIETLVMILGISELLQLTLTRKPFQEMLLGNVLEVTSNLDMENLSAIGNNSSGETKNIEN
ncbi:uncharacterized protein LOC110041503 [Orbicella faveolata]|uniref:uncharacterized protein LOC110041503 n=1 Tax=Orbicella faveolata TaxID=48498 RepID=UPI0009E2440B|nr:uncharacterized protein LOC110041503 [Orbicella faveolata]